MIGSFAGIPAAAAEAASPIVFHFDFHDDITGWSAVFSDYPVAQEEDVDQEAGLRPLAVDEDEDRSGV